MKFALFFLVAACFAQGYQSRVVEVQPHNITDIVERIVDAVRQFLIDFGDDIPAFIQELREKIKLIIENRDEILEEIRNRIQEAIDRILALADLNPEDVRACIAAERESVHQLIQEDIIPAVLECRQITHDELQGLHVELVELRSRVQELIGASAAVVQSCRADNSNLEDSLRCIKEHSSELKPQADAVLQQIKAAIDAADGVLIPAHIEHFKCLHQIHQNNIPKEQAIIASFRQCIEDSRQ